MGLRTFQITGKAYSLTGDVTINAVFNGVTVHNGIVPTTVLADPDQNTAREVLFQFDVDDTLYGVTVPSSFTVTGGSCYIAGLAANNVDPADLTAFNYPWQTLNQGAVKTNIMLDGALSDVAETYGWHYQIPDGSTMTIDWALPVPNVGANLPGCVETTVDLCVVGKEYRVWTPGTTDFTTMGAADSLRNTVFVCTAAGTGTGTVFPTGA